MLIHYEFCAFDILILGIHNVYVFVAVEYISIFYIFSKCDLEIQSLNIKRKVKRNVVANIPKSKIISKVYLYPLRLV